MLKGFSGVLISQSSRGSAKCQAKPKRIRTATTRKKMTIKQTTSSHGWKRSGCFLEVFKYWKHLETKQTTPQPGMPGGVHFCFEELSLVAGDAGDILSTCRPDKTTSRLGAKPSCLVSEGQHSIAEDWFQNMSEMCKATASLTFACWAFHNLSLQLKTNIALFTRTHQGCFFCGFHIPKIQKSTPVGSSR